MLGIAPKVHLRLSGKADPHPASRTQNIRREDHPSYSNFQGAVAFIIGTLLPSVNLPSQIFANHPMTFA